MSLGVFDYRIQIRIHTESRFRFSEKVHSNNKSESGFRFGETCLQIHYMLTDLKSIKSFDLPSESETICSVNPNLDSVIEYALCLKVGYNGLRI